MRGPFDDLLDYSAAVAMQANKYELFFGSRIDTLLLYFRANLEKLLHDIIAKFIIDQLGNPMHKRLEYFIPDSGIALIQGIMQIPGSILILAPLSHKWKIGDDLLTLIVHWIVF